MLSTSIAPDSIAAAAQLIHQSQFTQSQQQHIENTISAIAQHNHWPRHRAAQWLDRQTLR